MATEIINILATATYIAISVPVKGSLLFAYDVVPITLPDKSVIITVLFSKLTLTFTLSVFPASFAKLTTCVLTDTGILDKSEVSSFSNKAIA